MRLPESFSLLANPSSVLRVWGVLKSVPGGGLLMGRLIGRLAPYTGTIRAEVEALEVGYARARMRDRKRLRNHLNSVHAIALMNLGELTTGVAMMASLPEGARGIPNRLAMDYVKKARGTITAECRCATVSSTERKEYQVTAELKDPSGELVARAFATWLIGPVN